MNIRELLNLPDHVLRGEFLFAIEQEPDADDVVGSYVAPDELGARFERALAVVDTALSSKQSAAVAVRGPFGVGKSHFLGVLSLMLANRSIAWDLPALATLRDKNAWLGTQRTLVLSVTAGNVRRVADAVFRAYVDWWSATEPHAPIPGVFRDRALFDEAEVLRLRLGDTRFFAEINTSGLPTQWDSARFEQAISSRQPEPREELLAALVRTHFSGYVSSEGPFLGLAAGLDGLARHAKALGFDCVAIMFDGLERWLRTHPDVDEALEEITHLKAFVKSEGRALPIVTFVSATQALSSTVGFAEVGRMRRTLEDALEQSLDANFHALELPAGLLFDVIKRRVTQARTPEAETGLARGAEKSMARAGDALHVLLAGGTAQDLEKVYPFSPASVEVAAGLSACFDGKRTPAHLLVEFLVEHTETIEEGTLVPVGDLFDLAVGGEEPADPIMRHRVDTADFLYNRVFLPRIRGQHGTDDAISCQRLRADHFEDLGCAKCAQRACRNDNRLVKTALLAALVPGVRVFESLDVTRLVALNAPEVPLEDVAKAHEQLLSWAQDIGQLEVGPSPRDRVAVRLEGVDLPALLAHASDLDTPTARRAMFKRVLFEQMGIRDGEGPVVESTVRWRGTRRKGCVRIGDVRQLPDSALRGRADDQWVIVIDYPAEAVQAEATPSSDSVVQGHATKNFPTVLWLPGLVPETLHRALGERTVVEHLLRGETHAEAMRHLSPGRRARARLDLKHRKQVLDVEIGAALRRAFGLVAVAEGSDTVPTVVHALCGQPGPIALTAHTFSAAMAQLATQVLDRRFPRHPDLCVPLNEEALHELQRVLELLLDTDSSGIRVASRERQSLQEIAIPLGLVKLHNGSASLDEDLLIELEGRRHEEGLSAPTVAQVRDCLDPERTLGLTRETEDLFVWLYSQWSRRRLMRDEGAFAMPQLGLLPDDVVLEQAQLPSTDHWTAATGRAQQVFGLRAPKRLTTKGFDGFMSEVRDAVARLQTATELPAMLELRLRRWAPSADAPRRLETAKLAASLLAKLDSADDTEKAHILATFPLDGGSASVGASLEGTATVLAKLLNASLWQRFESVETLRNSDEHGAEARGILRELASALRSDEGTTRLGPSLERLAAEAEQTVARARGPEGGGLSVSVEAKAETLELAIVAMMDDLRARLHGFDGPVQLRAVVDAVREGGDS